MYDIIIIGAGPAGMAAAIYAARSGKSVLIIEKSMVGGQIIYAPKIKNYPAISEISGYNFAMNMLNQAFSYGAKIVYEDVVSIVEQEYINEKKYKKVITNKNSYECKSIIIAIGLSKKKLNVTGESKYDGKGVSYCAICDGGFYKNKDVAVVGGGNTAVSDAIFLSNICGNVYIIHRKESFRAEKKLIESMDSIKNIHQILNANVEEILGDESVYGISVEVCENRDENNKYNDKNKYKCRQKIDVQGVFIAVGQIPSEMDKNENYKGITLDKDERGYILSDENCKTNIEGIFVAGDIRKKEIRQLTTATSDGTIAALRAVEYVNNYYSVI